MYDVAYILKMRGHLASYTLLIHTCWDIQNNNTYNKPNIRVCGHYSNYSNYSYSTSMPSKHNTTQHNTTHW